MRVDLKYSVQVTDVATGKVQVLDVEASSEEEAIRKFDVSKFDVTVVKSSADHDRDQARIERMKRELPVQHSRGVKLILSFVVMIIAAIVGLSLSAYLRSVPQRNNGDWNRPENSDVEKALINEVLRDR